VGDDRPQTDPGDTPDDDELFAALYPSLRRFAAAIRPPHVDADDLVQEAVARALRTKRSLGAIDDPARYLRVAVLRIASNERRGWSRRLRAFARAADPPETHDTPPSDLAELLRIAPSDRAALYLTAVDGLSHREAAQLLGCSEDAARTRAARARRRLREALLEADE